MGDRGSLVLVNGTPYTWQLAYVRSYQLAQWDSSFPRTIAPFSSAAVTVQRPDNTFRLRSQDGGEATYSLLTNTANPPSFQVQARADGGQPFRLQAWLKNIAAQNNAVGSIVLIGWVVGGRSNFVLAGRGPVYVCNDLAEAWLQTSLSLLGARSLRQLCKLGSHDVGAGERSTVLTQVFSYLSSAALARATRVSRAWRAIIDSDPVLWCVLLKSNQLWFGGGSEHAFADAVFAGRARIPAPPGTALPLPHPYKLLFKRRHLARTRWLENDPPRPLNFPAHGSAVITCLLVSHNRIISSSDDHSIHVHSPFTGHLLKSLDDHGGGVWALAATKNTLVSGSTDCTVRVWDLEMGRCTHVFGGHTSTVRCLAIVKPVWVDVEIDAFTKRRERWPKRPLIVSGSRDKTLRVWKLPREGDEEYKSYYGVDDGEKEDVDDNPYHERLLEGHDGAVRALAARGRTLVSASYDCTVRVWDIITGVCKWVLVGHTQNVYNVVLDHARNQVFSGSMDGAVRVWSLATGQCVHTLTGHTSLVGFLGLSSSHLVSASGDSTLRIWDAGSGQLMHTLAAHTGAITCFQHDEFKVLSGSDNTLKLWDVREGTPVSDLLTSVTGVFQVAFKGRWCVAASNKMNSTYLDVWDFGRQGDSDEDWDMTGEGNLADDSEDEEYEIASKQTR